jgi:acyl carrier protein
MPDVVDALVTQRPGPDGAPVTTGYVTGPDPATDPVQIRKDLQGSLPDYLVPHQIVVLAQLPLTPQGGYDLAALPQQQARPAPTTPYVAPRTPMERRLAVADLLGVPRVGLGDSFFALGGSSMQAFQLTTRIDEMFGAQLLLRDVFAAPTVEEMTQLIVQANRGLAGVARERMRRRWRLTIAESDCRAAKTGSGSRRRAISPRSPGGRRGAAALSRPAVGRGGPLHGRAARARVHPWGAGAGRAAAEAAVRVGIARALPRLLRLLPPVDV